METDGTLIGTSHAVETTKKVVTTHEGDEGRTSLGIHGFVAKEDARVDLLGGLDLLRTHANTLPQPPEWVAPMLTDMMVCLIKPLDILHDERMAYLEQGITSMRDNVTFSKTGWFMPSTEKGKQWDMFRVFVRQVERDSWRAFVFNEKKERYKEISQLLNRLSDYAFLRSMLAENEK